MYDSISIFYSTSVNFISGERVAGVTLRVDTEALFLVIFSSVTDKGVSEPVLCIISGSLFDPSFLKSYYTHNYVYVNA